MLFSIHLQAVLESLLGMMIGSFDFYALSSVEAVIGPIFFTLYIFAAYFMLANMLITIIVEAFAKVINRTYIFTHFPLCHYDSLL